MKYTEKFLDRKYCVYIDRDSKPVLQQFNLFDFGKNYNYTMGAYYSFKDGSYTIGSRQVIDYKKAIKLVHGKKELYEIY